jgi:hypothetical protein
MDSMGKKCPLQYCSLENLITGPKTSAIHTILVTYWKG